MQYNAPINNGGDTNAAYIQGNAALGIQGSLVPAPAVEAPQREIVSVIANSGLTPAGGDNSQLLKAIQLDVPHIATIGGTANARTFTLTPTPAALIDGFKFRGYVPAPNTGPATMGGLPVVNRLGAPLSGGEMFNWCEFICGAGTEWLLDTWGPPVTQNLAGLSADFSFANDSAAHVVNTLTGISNADVTIASNSVTINRAGLYLLRWSPQLNFTVSAATALFWTIAIRRNGGSVPIISQTMPIYIPVAASNNFYDNQIGFSYALQAGDVLDILVTAGEVGSSGNLSACKIKTPANLEMIKIAG